MNDSFISSQSMQSSLVFRTLTSQEIENLKLDKNLIHSNFLKLDQMSYNLQNQINTTSNFPKKNTTHIANLHSLPYDCLLKIVFLLDAEDIFNVLRTCCNLNALSKSPLLLKNLVKLQCPEIYKSFDTLMLDSWPHYSNAAFALGRIEQRIEQINNLETKIVKTQKTTVFIIVTVICVRTLFNLLTRK